LFESQFEAHFLKIDQLVAWDHKHGIPNIAVDHDSLGNLPWGQVLRRGGVAGRKGGLVDGMRVGGLIGLKELA
jgi:hypothetical protein